MIKICKTAKLDDREQTSRKDLKREYTEDFPEEVPTNHVEPVRGM